MKKVLALLLIVAMPCFAQDVVDVERAAIVTDGGTIDVTGGCWLSTGKCIDTGKEMARLRKENEALKASPPAQVQSGPSFGWFVAGLCLGVVAGGLVVLFNERGK